MDKEFVKRLDKQALERLLTRCGDTVEGVIFRLAWKQGLTREEMRNLTWNDLLFSEHQICLPDRTVPLEPETEVYLRRRAEHWESLSPHVVISDRRRQQMPPESISRLARKAMNQAGIQGVNLMDLRHDFIIRQLQAHDWPYVVRISGISVSTLHAYFSTYLTRGRAEPEKSAEEIDSFLMWRLLQTEGSSVVGLALWMSWKLGMQVQEIVSLTWSQVDLDRGLIRLSDHSLSMGVTLRRLLRSVHSSRRPEDDPHVLLLPNSRKPMDQPRLSKIVRTALIRGGLEHVNLGDLCRDARQKAEETRLLAYAAQKGTVSRGEVMALLDLSKAAAYQRLRQLASQGKLVRVGGKYYPAGQVVPPAEQYEVICAFLEESGPAYRQDLASLLHIGARQCGLILRHMVEDGRLRQTGQRYDLPLPQKAIL